MKTKTTSEKDEQFYHQVQESLVYHQILLRDERRNKLFYKALKSVINSESRVLDIGSGSGVWAIAAARLGAKSVTAIESNQTMLPVIMGHAAENGVSDRVTIINGTSHNVKLKHKFDVIVSETIGNQAFDENIIPTMVDARSRFLAPGGKMIPQKVALMAAPVNVLTEGKTPLGVPIGANYISSMALNLPMKIFNKADLKLLDSPKKLIEVDLRNCDSDQSLADLSASWNLKSLHRANAVALWAECELVDGIVLDVWDTTNWMPIVCRFRSFEEKKGTLNFSLTISGKLYHWKVESAGMMQAYAPVFAYTKLKFDSMRAPRIIRQRRR